MLLTYVLVCYRRICRTKYKDPGPFVVDVRSRDPEGVASCSGEAPSGVLT